MASVVRVQFRPTIIVFVGESGAKICASLLTLGRLLPNELHNGVALIEVGETATSARLHAGLHDDSETHDKLRLSEALHTALRTVQADRTVSAIQRAGHAVPMRHPQIYIVGHTSAPSIGDVVDEIRDAITDPTPLAANITFLLSDMPPSVKTQHEWLERLSNEHDMPHVDFCFLYEELGQQHTFHRQEDIEYAAAEALFALSATAVPAAPVVQQATQKSLGATDVDARIGSLGTSLILFPRPEAERYCTDLLAAELMQNWTETNAAAEHNEDYHSRASEDMEAIFTQLADNDERPGAGGPPWANLTSILDERHALQLERRTTELFNVFDYDQVADDSVRSRENWRSTTQRREGTAIISFHVWEQVARAAWLAAGEAVAGRVTGTVEELWLAEDKGAPAALAYVQRVEEGVQLLREKLIAWRVAHANDYSRDLTELDERSEGPWLQDPTPLPPRTSSFTSSTGSLHIEASRLPAREQELVGRMERRVAWAEDRLPPWLNLIAVCLMACPPIILLILDSLPNGWGTQALAAIIVTLAIGGFSVAACTGIRRRAETKLIAARQDLLAVFRRYYAYRCERREDELRVVVLGPFHRRVSRMCERLEHMQRFVATVRQGLLDDATNTRDTLFDSAAGQRDVYVANGERLTKDGAYTLDDLYAEVSRRRQTTPEEEDAWHHSTDRMVASLRQWLSKRKTSFLDLPDVEVEGAVREFSSGIIRTYLVGDLVDLQHALAAKGERRKEIWREALRRSHVLFRPMTSPQPSVLVGGVDLHRTALETASPHPDAIHIRTQHPDWLLVAQFCPGGALTRWSDTKETLASATPDVASQAVLHRGNGSNGNGSSGRHPQPSNQPIAIPYGSSSQATRPKGG